MRPDSRQKMFELLRASEPVNLKKLEYCRTHMPDPQEQPAAHAFVKAYMERLEIVIGMMRDPELLTSIRAQHPAIFEEMPKLESWLGTRNVMKKGSEVIAEKEGRVGDWLVSIGYSYAEAKEMLGKAMF